MASISSSSSSSSSSASSGKRKRDESVSEIAALPNELLVNIFQQLPIKSIATVGMVSHRFNALTKEPSIWIEKAREVNLPISSDDTTEEIQKMFNQIYKITKHCLIREPLVAEWDIQPTVPFTSENLKKGCSKIQLANFIVFGDAIEAATVDGVNLGGTEIKFTGLEDILSRNDPKTLHEAISTHILANKAKYDRITEFGISRIRSPNRGGGASRWSHRASYSNIPLLFVPEFIKYLSNLKKLTLPNDGEITFVPGSIFEKLPDLALTLML